MMGGLAMEKCDGCGGPGGIPGGGGPPCCCWWRGGPGGPPGGGGPPEGGPRRAPGGGGKAPAAIGIGSGMGPCGVSTITCRAEIRGWVKIDARELRRNHG